MDKIDTIGSIDTLESIDIIDTIDIIETLDSIDNIDSIENIDSVDSVDKKDTIAAAAATTTTTTTTIKQLYQTIGISHYFYWYALFLVTGTPFYLTLLLLAITKLILKCLKRKLIEY